MGERMKLQDALKKNFWQFGVVVLQEKRLMALLSDFNAFDEYPAMRQVMEAVSDDGYANELYELILNGNRENFSRHAADVKKLLVSERNFLKELACYAVDCISFGLCVNLSVDEPSYQVFYPFNHDQQSELCSMPPSVLSGLGEKYYYGRGGPHDYKEAAKYFLKAAQQGEANAQFRLSYMCEHGMGVEQNYTRALYWFRKFSVQGPKFEQNRIKEHDLKLLSQISLGDPRGQCEYGDIYKDQFNYREAIKWYSKAAEQGFADALYKLGRMYGYGVSHDGTKAIDLYEKAADKGNADAQYSLGQVYEYGFGVEMDETEALEWFEKAAAQGHADAQYSLGKVYEYVYGVERDDTKACEWYEKAASRYYSQPSCRHD